jgi:phosphoglycerate kinase
MAEPESVDTVKRLQELAKREDTEVLLPHEVVVSKSLEQPLDVRTVSWTAVGADDYIVDAAPSYAELLKTTIYEYLDFDGKSTVIWNGPLGITEIPEFAAGSKAMAEAILATNATSIVGGGDTAAFVDAQGLHDKFTWVSTGGGASLELMAGRPMPGIDNLLDK